MSKVTGSQTHCARCRARFAEPLKGRNSVICEDCEAAEAAADELMMLAEDMGLYQEGRP